MVANPVPTAKTPKPPTDTVRLRSDYVRRLNRLAGHAGRTLPDYLADLLGPLLDERETVMFRELAAELGKDASPPPETPAKKKR